MVTLLYLLTLKKGTRTLDFQSNEPPLKFIRRLFMKCRETLINFINFMKFMKCLWEKINKWSVGGG